MTNKHENKLWHEIGWLRFLLAVLATIILGVIYLTIWGWNTSVWRDLFLSVVGNTIPVPLIFVFAYIAFRRIEELRSERDVDEIVDKVALRLSEVTKTPATTSGDYNSFSEQPIQFSELELKLHREFEITNKYFDNKSKPQKIVIQFTNRGNNLVYVNKVRYSHTGLGLPDSAMSKSYRVDDGRILINQNRTEVTPEGKLIIELLFDGKWDIERINGWSGKWGYLHLELTYADEVASLQYSI